MQSSGRRWILFPTVHLHVYRQPIQVGSCLSTLTDVDDVCRRRPTSTDDFRHDQNLPSRTKTDLAPTGKNNRPVVDRKTNRPVVDRFYLQSPGSIEPLKYRNPSPVASLAPRKVQIEMQCNVLGLFNIFYIKTTKLLFKLNMHYRLQLLYSAVRHATIAEMYIYIA